VFLTLDDAVHQQEVFPALGDRVAMATLEPRHGKTKLTPGKQPTHTTWWPYVGVQRAERFAVCWCSNEVGS
jgi:hypothetical protein